jgi:hypothetical protein
MPFTLASFTSAPLAVRRRAPVARRGGLRVVAHGGVGGSGGPQYPGKDKEFGSDQAPWRKKLILDDPDQADPDANQGRSSGGWTPPPPAQVPTDSGFGGGAADVLLHLLLGRRPRPPRRRPPGTPAPAAPSSGGAGEFAVPSGAAGGSTRKDVVTYDPDQYDPDANTGRGSGFSAPSGAPPPHRLRQGREQPRRRRRPRGRRRHVRPRSVRPR